MVGLITQNMASKLMLKRDDYGHKGTFGKLQIIGGSYGMSGAVILAAKSAIRCGTGLLNIATPRKCADALATQVTECTYTPLTGNFKGQVTIFDINGKILPQLDTYTAVLCGCGLGDSSSTKRAVRKLIKNCNKPMVLDADALNIVAKDLRILGAKKAPIIITPHLKEMSRLTGLEIDIVKKYPYQTALEFAKEYDVTVVLKDSTTYIANPQGDVFFHDRPNSGLAKGGNGDVLAGMIGAFLSNGMSTIRSSLLAVYLQGQCGDYARQELTEYMMQPSDTIEFLPKVFKELLEKNME